MINEYGASEVGIIAFETPNDEWLLSEELLFYEVINKHDYQDNSGSIVLTDLQVLR